MSLRIKHLNADTSFLLIFSPACAEHDPQGTFPGSFRILLDPWLNGDCKIWSSRFALTRHTVPACIESLAELPEPDLVLISQDKPDHCHEETLTALPSNTSATILGTSAAIKKVKSWKHFDPSRVQALKRFDEKSPSDTVHRIRIPAYSPAGSDGEVTISLLGAKVDLVGLHTGIAITYRAPYSVLSSQSVSLFDLPLTPPATPPGSLHEFSRNINPATLSSSTLPAVGNKETTLSVLYSPHGISYNLVKPFASTHLVSEAALPLTALLHPFDRLDNAWYLGGRISNGTPGGIELARNLLAKAWIGAHDEEKESSGFSVKGLRVEKYDVGRTKAQLQASMLRSSTLPSASGGMETRVLNLEAGDELFIPATTTRPK